MKDRGLWLLLFFGWVCALIGATSAQIPDAPAPPEAPAADAPALEPPDASEVNASGAETEQRLDRLEEKLDAIYDYLR